MQWFENYREDLKWAFKEAASITARFVSPFDTQALDYLKLFNVLEREVPNNYISFLLPFWMEDLGTADRNLTRQMSLANLFGMMAYQLLDQAMDNPAADRNQIIPLSTKLHLEFIQQYASLFPHSSPFWTYFRQYLGEWAISVSMEQRRDWLHEEPVRMGHKAALVKLGGCGSLLLAGKEEEIPTVSDAVDQVLVVLQMLDDWGDWEKDLGENNYNSLIAHIRSSRHFPGNYKMQPLDIREGIYTYGLLSSYGELAVAWEQQSIREMKTRLPQLYGFYRFLLDNLLDGGRRVEEERKLLEKGALHYYLSKKS